MTIRSLEISAIPPRGPFFKNQRPLVCLELYRAGLPIHLGKKVADYLVGNENPFGSKEWKKYYGVDVGSDPKLPKEFYTFWNGPDPINPTKRVWETHLPPILRPESVTPLSTNIRLSYTLGMLGLLIQQPKEGYRTKYCYHSSKGIHQNENIKAGPVCWLVLRKGLFDKTFGDCPDQQRRFVKNLNLRTQANYEEGIAVLDLATALCARYVFTGERHLCSGIGMKRRWIYSQCKETFYWCPLIIGGFSLKGLNFFIYPIMPHLTSVGMAGLRKF